MITAKLSHASDPFELPLPTVELFYVESMPMRTVPNLINVLRSRVALTGKYSASRVMTYNSRAFIRLSTAFQSEGA